MGNSERRKFSLIMDHNAILLSLVLAIITFTTPASSAEPRVVCYYTNWSVYRPGTARFNPQNINPYLCTHLIYAFGGFTKDNALKPFDKYQDIEKGGYAKFTGLKTYNKNLKTLLAIGGWNEGSSRFSPMVAAKDRRREFVRNAIKFLRQNRFDGLDLDWEYPAFRDGGKPKDRENYAKLVKELREEFEREAQKTGRPRLLLTMAVPAGIEYIQKGFDVKTLNKYLDWMNLLTYDYHSAFEPAVNHHAPLYPLEEPNEYSVDNELNIDYTIKFYLENGADADKLVLGIPTYGRSYTLFNPDATELGAPADGPGEQGDATREKGYLAYYEICEALKPKTKKKRATDDDDDDDEDESEEQEDDEEDEPWTVNHPNPKAMGPFAYRGNQWVGYDDIDIVKKKAEYVAENGLGGIMFWSIDNDDFRGTCHNKPYPLIESAKEAYISRLGSTDNVVVSERPKPVTSSSSRRRNRPRATSTTTTTSKPSSAAAKSNKRKQHTSGSSVTSTTPTWNIITPEPPTTPDPGSDFKCKDEGFFPHPRDCKKYFWCLDSGPSNLGIVAHHFTCPSGLFFNKAADSCDFARNVLCKMPAETTKAPATKAPATKAATTESATTTTRRSIKLSTKNSALFRTTTTTTAIPESEEEEYEDEDDEDSSDIEAEDPKVIKELIDLIKKLGGVEQLEKHLHYSESPVSTDGAASTTPSPAINKKLLHNVLQRTRKTNRFSGSNSISEGSSNSRRGPQNAGIQAAVDSADTRATKRDGRPQYTTINRNRGTSSTTPEPEDEADSVEEPEVSQVLNRARSVESNTRAGTTAKPLQYVNIRRPRPTSDTADDTASRNALFERVEPYVTVSEASNTLDIASARRENTPEYVTIRRQKPTTEQATTLQYENTEAEESLFETILEKEISSPPSQPQYTSIVRSRSTTVPPSDAPSDPEPTTVLAVQISSLLNAPNPEDTPINIIVDSEQSAETTEVTEPPTTPTTTIKTTTTAAPSSLPTRRTVLRRRGSTTTTTTSTTITPAPSSSTTQVQTDRHNNFLRRTKATAPPDTSEPVTATDPIADTTTISTNKYTRRGASKFKTPNIRKDTKKETKVADGIKEEKDAGGKIENRTRQPSLTSSKRSERPTRTYVRRRVGGANVTTTTTSKATINLSTTRRPFRVASRRRPSPTTSTLTKAALTTTTTADIKSSITSSTTAESKLASTAGSSTSTTLGTTTLTSEESLQDIEERESIEDPALSSRNNGSIKKTVKIQRRPLTSLKELDQNPSATNEDKKGTIKEDERKRHSKKYSSSFKQNQLDEVLRQKSKSQEEFDVTATEGTNDDDYNGETAVAIAAHKLLSAPLPLSDTVFDDQAKTSSKKSTKNSNSFQTTQDYQNTSPGFVADYDTDEIPTPVKKISAYSSTPSSYTSTPIYRTSFADVTNPSYSPNPAPGLSSSVIPLGGYSSGVPKTSGYSSTPGYATTREYTNAPRLSPFSSATPQRSSGSTPTGFIGNGYSLSQSLGPSTARYLETSNKYVAVPVEDYGYTGGLSQEPSYFTREYLLESPVTKTYDDEYQYLSPVTTPQVATTRKSLPKKTVYRKISTTLRPTEAPLPVLLSTTVKPRRIPQKKPFEKIAKPDIPNRTYRPIENYDYYDDSQEKVHDKYEEGTKVVIHGKGTIECLDSGNFPHPTSCKKFISCARMEGGAILGWEYVCPKGLSFDPVGGICNWSAGLGCNES